MEATQQWTTLIVRPHRPWLLVGRLLVGRNTKEAMILLVGDRLVGPKGALLVDLRLVESSPPWYFALLVGTRLVDVPLRDTHGRAEGLLLVVWRNPNPKKARTGQIVSVLCIRLRENKSIPIV
jgi:hypothetical protein